MSTHDPISFEVNINWLADTRGIISSPSANGTVHVATPPEFGGTGKPWTPEHFFLSAISSCFMTTYLVFVRKFKFELSHLECKATGNIAMVNGKLGFTEIHLYPKIYVPEENMIASATSAVEKTHKYCLISNSINVPITYHDEILTGLPPNMKPGAVDNLVRNL